MSHLKFHLKVKHRTSDGGSPKQSPRGYTGGPGETLRGYLKKQGDNGPVHSWKTRYFLQKPGSTSRLYYYPTHNSTTPKGFIDLNEVSSVESGKTGFYFKIFTPNRTYHLKASNEEELNYWVEGITTELGNLKKESSQEMLKRCKPTAPSRYKTTNKFVKQFLMAEACTSGDIKAAQELLKDKDIDINFWVEGKSAPIVLACSQKIEFAKMFIEDPRADLNCCDDTNGTPLLHAISSENIDVIRALLKDERLGSWDDEDTLTILCAVESGNAEILSCILEHPPLQKLSNPAALEENFGTTSLHYACMSNNLDKVMSLLEDEDLDPNEPDSMQMTPLHVASCLGFLEIVQALLDDPRVDTEIFSDHGYTALHFACKKGHVDVVNFLLVDPRVNPNASAGDETPFGVIDKNTPNAAEIITALLEHPDIDLDMPCTILEDLPFHHFCVNGNAEILKILLEDPRIDPTIPNAVDDPPLLLAVGQGNTETVRTLLSDDRIQPDILNQENENLFYIAARSGHAGVIQALLDDNRLDPTALKEDINSLMEALPIQIAYARGQTDCVKILCSVPKVQENFASTIQRNELFLACAKGDSETVKKVLADSHTDVNFTDAKGRSSLHLAAVTEDTEILELLLNHPEIKVNLQDRTDKETPLHAACSRGRIKSVDILLSHPKIDPTAQDSVNETPFTNACRMDNYFFIKMLLKHPRLGDSFLGDIPSLALFTLSEIGVEDSILNMILSDSRVKSAVPSTLCYACKYGNANFVQQILAAKLISKDEKLFKQCFEACGKPSSKVAEEWDQEEEDITTIKQLLQEYFEK